MQTKRRTMILIRKCSRLVAACIVATASCVSTVVSAEGLDGSSDIVCAVMRVVACLENGECLEGQAKTFEIPVLYIIDADKNVLRGTYESGEKAVSPIKNKELNGEQLVLQGVENGRGWSVAVNTVTGAMSGAGVGDDVSFLVDGACAAP